MSQIIKLLFEWWPHDDTPGYTDHPEIDIQVHRANAKWATRFGFLGLVAGLASGALHNSALTAAAGIGWFALAEYAAMNLRLQALEWESQLRAYGENDP